MNFNILKYEYTAPRGTIMCSKTGWRYVSSMEDVNEIYTSIEEYLDKISSLTDREVSKLFKVSVDSNAREYGTGAYKVDVTAELEKEQRMVVARNFSKSRYSQSVNDSSDVFAPLEDTIEILNQSFNFFTKNGKFTEEEKENNAKISRDVLSEIVELREDFKNRFEKIFNKEEYISEQEARDKKWFNNYQREQKYKNDVEKGILSWYVADFKNKRANDRYYIPYERKQNPDYYKMIIDENTGEGTIYKLKDESDVDNNGRGYKKFYAVCSDEIEKEVGKIPNADGKKAEEFIRGLNKKYDTIRKTEPGWRIETGFEDSGD